MKIPGVFCASVCHRGGAAIAIAIALAACGGVIASPDDGRSDAGSPVPSGDGCPTAADIHDRAAVGRACAPEGAYCPEPGCDPCTMECGAVSCTHGAWKTEVNTALCIPTPDAGSDAAACVEIDPTTFDQSCHVDADCMTITPGTFCSGEPWCMCPFGVINVDGKSRYEAELAEVKALTPGPRGCSCPAGGVPRCVQGSCILCGGIAPRNAGCPDGG